MSWIKDRYTLTYGKQYVGSYYIFDDNTHEFTVNTWESEIEACKELLKEKGLLKDIKQNKPIAALAAMMTETNRVPGRKREIYVDGPFTLTRIPQETGDRYLVYSRCANENEQGYSEKDHSAAHYEGPHTPEGMREWTSWYAFDKMDDGTYQASLDEAWWWGGSHNDGGTIHTEIPEEWFELPYDEFLENVVTLSAASHYGFTPEELKAKEGLKEFFGFQ